MNTATGWRDRAACHGHSPRIFFPDPKREPATVTEAKTICARCPVRPTCLRTALQPDPTIRHREGRRLDPVAASYAPDGIWGGLTPTERGHLIRRLALDTKRNAIAYTAV